MNYENLKWINQSLFSHRDKEFETHGYLDISISLNTEDELNFSQPKLVLNLDNQGQRRSMRLSYSNIIDLNESILDITNNIQKVYTDKDPTILVKKYNKDKDLIIKFFMLNQQQGVVSISINNSMSDVGTIIVSLKPIFVSINRLFKLFESEYIKFCTDLPNRYLTSLLLIEQRNQTRLLQILPSQITPVELPVYNQDKGAPEVETSDVKYTDSKCAICGEDQFDTPSGVTCKNGHGGADAAGLPDPINLSEFEQFTEETIDEVRIPELESETLEPKEPIIQEFKSPFIEHTLKNNIKNLEEMMQALVTENNPFRTIMDQIHNGEGYQLLPGISEQDLKSAMYISNLYFKINFNSYIQTQATFPLIIPVVKYKTNEKIDRETIELSYDLLLINAYLKIYRGRMEAINSDPYTNGSLTHFCFRCFMDIAAFSYLDNANIEAVKNCVLARFKYFRETGFFDHFDKNLEAERQKKIYDGHIAEFIDKVFDNVLEADDINKRHYNAYDQGSVKVPPKNDFNLEQITNDIVKLELKTLFGSRIEDLTNDDEIILMFNKKLKKKYKSTDHKPPKRKVETHVLRYIKLKANEMNENKREAFIKYIEDMGDNKYDYFNDQFKLEELNDTALKTVYIWNSYFDEKMKYNDFAAYVEDCIDSDIIISKIKELNEDETKTEELNEWSEAFGSVEF